MFSLKKIARKGLNKVTGKHDTVGSQYNKVQQWDHSVYGHSQWEMAFQSNIISNRLSPYPEWSQQHIQLCSIYHVYLEKINHVL